VADARSGASTATTESVKITECSLPEPPLLVSAQRPCRSHACARWIRASGHVRLEDITALLDDERRRLAHVCAATREGLQDALEFDDVEDPTAPHSVPLDRDALWRLHTLAWEGLTDVMLLTHPAEGARIEEEIEREAE